MDLSKENIEEAVIRELQDCLESVNAEDSIKEVVECNIEERTITVKFRFNVVESDEYIGLGVY